MFAGQYRLRNQEPRGYTGCNISPLGGTCRNRIFWELHQVLYGHWLVVSQSQPVIRSMLPTELIYAIRQINMWSRLADTISQGEIRLRPDLDTVRILFVCCNVSILCFLRLFLAAFPWISHAVMYEIV